MSDIRKANIVQTLVLSGESCNTCSYNGDSYCPYEPDARDRRPMICPKHSNASPELLPRRISPSRGGCGCGCGNFILLVVIAILIYGIYYTLYDRWYKDDIITDAISSGLSSSVYGNTPSNIINGGLAAFDNGLIYFCNENDNGKLYVISPDSGSLYKLNEYRSIYINVVGDRVYYCNESDDGKIYSIKIDGSDNKKISDDKAEEITVVDDRIYYRNLSDGRKIYSMKTNGSDKKQLTNESARSIYVTDDLIYYLYNSGILKYKLHTVRTDGSEQKEISDEYVLRFCVVNDRIYYQKTNTGRANSSTMFSNMRIMRLDGSGRKAINYFWEEYDRPRSIAAYADRIYYTATESGSFNKKIFSIKTDGSDRTQLSGDEEDVVSFNVAGDWILYINKNADGKLFIMKTNGSAGRLIGNNMETY